MLIIASLIAAVGLFALKFKAKPALILPLETESIISPAPATAQHVNPLVTSSDGVRQRPFVNTDDADASASTRAPAAPGKVSMPLVFQPLNREVWNLNDEQMAVIEQLRSRFLEDVGGVYQDPNDPGYLAKWQKAQPECDAELWSKLGKDFFQEAQLQAYASASFAARTE